MKTVATTRSLPLSLSNFDESDGSRQTELQGFETLLVVKRTDF